MEMILKVDTAITVPVNLFPLLDDTDFKTREVAVAYNATGLDLVWNFVTKAGAQTQTAVTPTDTGGAHDWTHVGDGLYKIEVPDTGGTINNDTEGYGWFSGIATGVLPWRGPVICFAVAATVDALLDGTGVLPANASKIGGTTQTGRDLGASVLLSPGTGTGQLDITSGVVKANIAQILGTALTETSGYLAAAFKKFFNVADAGVPTAAAVALEATLDDVHDDIQNETVIIKNRLGAWTGSGINTVLGAFRALCAKAAALTPSDLSDSTTFDNTTDSLESLEERTFAVAKALASAVPGAKSTHEWTDLTAVLSVDPADYPGMELRLYQIDADPSTATRRWKYLRVWDQTYLTGVKPDGIDPAGVAAWDAILEEGFLALTIFNYDVAGAIAIPEFTIVVTPDYGTPVTITVPAMPVISGATNHFNAYVMHDGSLLQDVSHARLTAATMETEVAAVPTAAENAAAAESVLAAAHGTGSWITEDLAALQAASQALTLAVQRLMAAGSVAASPAAGGSSSRFVANIWSDVRAMLRDGNNNQYTDPVMLPIYNRAVEEITSLLARVGTDLAMATVTITGDGVNQDFELPGDFRAFCPGQLRPRSPITATTNFRHGLALEHVDQLGSIEVLSTTVKDPREFVLVSNGTGQFVRFNFIPPSGYIYDGLYFTAAPRLESATLAGRTPTPWLGLLDELIARTIELYLREGLEFTVETRNLWREKTEAEIVSLLGLRHVQTQRATPSMLRGVRR